MEIATYLKTVYREIKNSFGRFISIVLIVLLGTLIYVGVKSCGPILYSSLNEYASKSNLSDLQLISTGGITNEDEKIANTIKDAKVESSYQFYDENKEDDVVQYFSYNKKHTQNKLTVTEGRLPKGNKEIVLDTVAKDKGYKINDKYLINSTDNLNNLNYKIVGFVNSPLFVSTTERGYINLGDGNVDFFAYIPEQNFDMVVKSILYFNFDNTKDINTNSKKYENIMDDNILILEKAFKNRPKERYDEIRKEANKEISDAQKKINNGLTSIKTAKVELDSAQVAINQQKQMLSSIPEDQKSQLITSEKKIDNQRKKIVKEEKKLLEAQEELNEKQKEIDSMKLPKYINSLRIDNIGFQDYKNLGDSIVNIASVFPAFFFFIAALISFSTTTRMIEENRGEIGTLKALGYGKLEISSKYIIYSIIALVLGISLGTIIGTNFIPRLLFSITSDRFNINELVIFYNWDTIAITTIAFLIAIIGSAIYILMKNLSENPASLMQAKAPKAGKRILLERITPLWKKLSFKRKISYRNLFRFKSRMIMTIIGIAGCTGLMIAGSGIKDSLDSVSEMQYGNISKYSAIVTQVDNKTSSKDIQETSEILSNDESVKSLIQINNQSVKTQVEGKPASEISMFTISTKDNWKSYLGISDLSGNKLNLDSDGAIITKNIAERNNIKKGDTITFIDEDYTKFKMKINGVANNYIGNYIYLSKDYYEKATSNEFTPNTFLIKTKDMSKKQETKLSESLLKSEKVSNVSYVSDQITAQKDSTQNLDSVVILFVVLSGMLAFVVLYNLTNINIHERIRELSTIKVLGFFNNEVSMYIVRENIVLVILGIITGYGVGYFLTDFILIYASLENMSLPLVIKPFSYIFASILTIIFATIVMIVTHISLKNINMLDALKSNE